jgi:DNA (cytosine-5)-methyltransferase 1
LSIREYARIQEFPDDWQFSGTLSQQYAQVGNAVPTRLGRIAGDVIAKELDQILEKDAHVDEIGSFEPRIIYLQSHVRTRQWFKDGETLVWEKGDRNEKVRYAEPKTLRKLRSI